jgi:6-pyruvoyltetrahydropterin/6-carboxytetrahydropterin synthase
MRYYVTKTYGHNLGLSATFRQWRAESHCRFIHGYALGFKLVFGANRLDQNGWVKDFGSLRPLKERLCETFDHRLLIARDDPYREHLWDAVMFAGAPVLADPIVVPRVGCESFAVMVWEWADELITDEERSRDVRMIEVECREHAGNAASYLGAN